LKLPIHVRASVSVDDNILEFQALEALAFDVDSVSVRNQVRDSEVAAVVRGGFVLCAFALVDDRYLGVRHGGAGRISDGTEYAAVDRLTGRFWRPETAEKRECCHSRKN
jgi:hypothetical protein